ESCLLQGRDFGAAELEAVRRLLATHPEWSRWRLSHELAARWEWRTARGQLKDMAARTLLLKLERRGLIALPPCRCASPNRMRHKRPPAAGLLPPAAPQAGPLAALRPVQLCEVSEGVRHPQRALCAAALRR